MGIQNLFDLTGKVALVTGASRGLGRAMSLALAEAGCHLALNARKAESLQEISGQIRGIGRKTAVMAGDVSDEGQVKGIVDSAVKEFGRIDVLVNNAGVWEGGFFFRMNKEDWDKAVSVNLTGAFLMAKAVGRIMMKQRSGKIIQISSILGLRGGPQSIVYSATKAGIIQMTRVMAIELAPAGIQVNAIAPGFFETDMTQRYQETPEALKAYIEKIPSKRVGKPEDLTGLTVFLASKASDRITGQTIVIDGGESLV